MKTILVDAVYTLVVKEGESYGIFGDMRSMLDAFPNRKIVVTNADDEGFKRFRLDLVPYEVFTMKHRPDKPDPLFFRTLLGRYGLDAKDVVYFEHDESAVESARSLGIEAYHYDSSKRDLAALKEFLDSSL